MHQHHRVEPCLSTGTRGVHRRRGYLSSTGFVNGALWVLCQVSLGSFPTRSGAARSRSPPPSARRWPFRCGPCSRATRSRRPSRRRSGRAGCRSGPTCALRCTTVAPGRGRGVGAPRSSACWRPSRSRALLGSAQRARGGCRSEARDSRSPARRSRRARSAMPRTPLLRRHPLALLVAGRRDRESGPVWG